MFFFFKQKTAYEMRISDWSSDVCSSDLTTRRESGMTSDLFEDERRDLVLADRAVLLAGFALPVEAALIDALDRVAARAPFRHMITPGGFQIGRASCRERVCQYV